MARFSAYAYAYAYGNPIPDSYAYGDTHTDAHTNAYLDADAYDDADFYNNANADGYNDANANGYANGYADGDTNGYAPATNAYTYDSAADAYTYMNHVVMLPERLQIGDVLCLRVRRVASIKADRLTVCCPKNQRFLYPTASDFEDVGNYVYGEELERVSASLKERYPDATQIRSSWPLIEKELIVRPNDSDVVSSDFVLCPRFKATLFPHRNWVGWPFLNEALCEAGHHVVVAGTEASKGPWGGATRVTDLESIAAHMLKTKLVVATDSGLAHLAILLRVPLALIWGSPVGVIPGQTYEKGYHKRMEAQKRGIIHHLEGTWENIPLALEEVLKITA